MRFQTIEVRNMELIITFEYKDIVLTVFVIGLLYLMNKALGIMKEDFK